MAFNTFCWYGSIHSVLYACVWLMIDLCNLCYIRFKWEQELVIVWRPNKANKHQMTISCSAHNAAVWLILSHYFSSTEEYQQWVNKAWFYWVFSQRLQTQTQQNDAKPTDNQQYLLLFTIKFYFWGIAAVCLYSNVARVVSKLWEMQWKSHYSVHMLEKMLAPGQIKRLLLNRNRLVRILVWKCSKGEVYMLFNSSATTWLL